MRHQRTSIEGEAPASQQVKSSRGSKVTWSLLVVCFLLAAALIVIYRLSFHVWKTNKCLQTGKAFLKCGEGWEQHGEQCYHFSADKFSWNRGRDECRGRGGDLVKIDSREEQIFLEMRLRDKMMDKEDKFWIGLTDSETEGTWLWVDGSALKTSLSFWSSREPDNWRKEDPDGEDCVRMGERGQGYDLECWFDKSCKLHHRSICEKPAANVCV
ncbi:hepatic lectin-like [Mugil cephalus]|uniref:hepatic lectin-like n=1 Tax=Mugil cephalus TaxID=48193 RepID=UPI001FB5F13F|nr:hepatic lectin-like [Mugil cephalus]XP_047460292.1 hepatic lectin-like [Mugil cephalus]